MTADEFRAALEHFGLSERAAARLFGVPSRSILKMASGDRMAQLPAYSDPSLPLAPRLVDEVAQFIKSLPQKS